MTETIKDSQSTKKESLSFFIIIGIAGLVFFISYLIKGFIESPLREASSKIAHLVLSALSFPVTRMGTILETPNMRFDVVPACSGSTTLQVFMSLGFYWCWTQPKLTNGRKALCTLLTIPVAIMANGLRVAMLVGMSHSIGEPIAEGLLHTIIGLLGFGIGLISLFFLTEILSSEHKSKKMGAKVWLFILLALLTMVYMPFISTCLYTWKGNLFNSFDSLGFVFIILALIPLVLSWRKSIVTFECEKLALVFMLSSMLIVLLGVIIDLKYLLGMSMIVTLFSFSMAFKGMRFALLVCPLLLLIYIGFPKTTVQLNYLTTRLFAVPIWDYSFFIRLPLAFACIGSFIWLKRKWPLEEKGEPRLFQPATLPIWVTIVVLVASVQIYIVSVATSTFIPSKLDMSYLQGNWRGDDLYLSRSSLAYFGRNNIWSRRYVKEGKEVEVLINASGGNRHRNHPPEYCMTGDGWQIMSSEKKFKKIGANDEVHLTVMKMKKKSQKKVFMYWFTDGKKSYSDYMNMMMSDTLRRVRGERTNWFLFRIISAEKESLMDAFLEEFDFSIKEDQET